MTENMKIDARASGNAQEDQPITWVPHWQIVRDEGAFEMNVSEVLWSTKHSAVIVKDADNNGCMFRTVHREDAQFTDSMPDGVRLLRAISRSLDVAGTPVELVQALKAVLPRAFSITNVVVEDRTMRRFAIND